MLEVRNLVRRFGAVQAVNGLSFSAGPAEAVALLGPAGAGKSTTLRLVSGCLAPGGGSVRVCDHDPILEPLSARRCLGFLPQGAPLRPELTPRAEFRFAAAVGGLVGRRAREAVERVAASMGLQAVLDCPLKSLPPASRRRVALARAVVHDPSVLLLDDLAAGLDPNAREVLYGLVRRLAAGRTLLVATQSLAEVADLCGRVLLLARGRLLFDGTVAEFRARSRRHGALRLVLAGAGTADALALLRSLAEVRQVLVEEEGPGGAGERLTLLLLPRPGASLLEPVLEQVAEHGWQVEDLLVERGSLDEVFRRMTTGHRGGEP